MTYKNAYDIFDLLNVGSIHNASITNITSDQLFQLRTLADSYEWGFNYNASEPMRSIGGRTLAGAITRQLNQTVTGKGKLKFSLLAGSYDTFLAFFGITGLDKVNPDFRGLPAYASTLAFELLTEQDMTSFPTNIDDLRVRFLFRNGSDDGAPLTPYPLFGKGQLTLKWTEFVTEMNKIAVTTVSDWCSKCMSKETFCLPYKTSSSSTPGSSSGAVASGSAGGMSNAVAGVIGAMVTLAVFLLIGAVAFLALRRRNSHAPVSDAAVAEHKAGSMSDHSK